MAIALGQRWHMRSNTPKWNGRDSLFKSTINGCLKMRSKSSQLLFSNIDLGEWAPQITRTCICKWIPRTNKSSQVNTLPIAKSQTRSKQNKGMHKCSSVYSEREVLLPVFTSGGELVGVRACKNATRVPPSLCNVTQTSDPATPPPCACWARPRDERGDRTTGLLASSPNSALNHAWFARALLIWSRKYMK
jgi:hypothetical protein